MSRCFSSIVVFLITALTLCSPAASDSQISTKSFIEVATGVFVRYGLHREISKQSLPHIANHGFVVGEKSVAIIDPGGSLKAAQSTLKAVEQLTELPVTHVIVSHMHPDHSVGLAAYSELPDTVILGHKKLADALYANLDFFTDNFIDNTERRKLEKLLDANRLQPISTGDTIDLGNRVLTLDSFDRAHTSTDITVLDNQHNLLWAGDLLFVERLPSLDGSLRGWVEALERLEQRKASIVIPGHGISGSWEQLVKPQRKYLTDLLISTRLAIKNGISLREYTNTASNESPNEPWKLYKSQHRTNLSRAYTELEWE